jgi:hypothetical protein
MIFFNAKKTRITFNCDLNNTIEIRDDDVR